MIAYLAAPALFLITYLAARLSERSEARKAEAAKVAKQVHEYERSAYLVRMKATIQANDAVWAGRA